MRLTWPDQDASRRAVFDGLAGPGAPFELVTEDVLGVPMQVFKNRPRNLRDMLLTAAERFGDRPLRRVPRAHGHVRARCPSAAAAVARTLARAVRRRQG